MKADPQAFSDDDAEQFADAFKPAWDAPDLEATTVGGPPSAVAEHTEEAAAVSSTLVMDRPSDWDLDPKKEDVTAVVASPVISVAPAAVPIAEPVTEKAPIPANNMKRTVIGLAPPANPMSAEVTPKEVARPAAPTAPEPILETTSAAPNLPFSSATSSPNVAAIASGGAPAYTMGMGTQVMANRPLLSTGPSRPPAAVATIGSLPGSPGYVASRPPQAPAMAGLTADPFRTRAGSSSDFDAYKPRKSNKAIVIGVIGVMALIGLGVGLKAVISDDAADKPKSEPIVTGPAATTAEIPPPPPPTEPTTAPAAKTAEPTSTTTTAAATAVPAPLPPPPQQHAAVQAPSPPAAVAPQRNADPPRRPTAPSPPPPQPAAAKTPQKGGNGGIVRDNPF